MPPPALWGRHEAAGIHRAGNSVGWRAGGDLPQPHKAPSLIERGLRAVCLRGHSFFKTVPACRQSSGKFWAAALHHATPLLEHRILEAGHGALNRDPPTLKAWPSWPSWALGKL
jgi:hypothetical protein